jgi:aspartate/tyrosine/aromatic aminotransferase
LAAKQVEHLIQKHHIYLTADGRISLAGLNTKNVNILADAIEDALKNGNTSKL